MHLGPDHKTGMSFMEQQLCFFGWFKQHNRNTPVDFVCDWNREHESMLLYHFLYMNIFILSLLSNFRCYKVTNAASVLSLFTNKCCIMQSAFMFLYVCLFVFICGITKNDKVTNSNHLFLFMVKTNKQTK